MQDARLAALVAAVRDHSGLSVSEVQQAGEHGADCGWAGFTYTSDARDFTRANESLVWDLLADEAEDFGSDVLTYVASFRRSDMASTPDGLNALLAWWALERAGRYLADTSEEREEEERERMREAGRDAGRAAASWLLNGNSTREAAETLLRGLLELDPMVLDSLPSNPLSGEWADAPSGAEVIAAAGLELDEEDPDRDEELLDAYSYGYSEGVVFGAEEEARRFLGIPEGAAAEVLTCCTCLREFVAASGVNRCEPCEESDQ